jgi:hypothetical protein
MKGVRAKISVRLEENGLVRVSVCWVEVEDNQVGECKLLEEFALSANRPDCAYVSRAVFSEGIAEPGTFWIDEKGARHFYMKAEAGAIALIGKDL